MKIRPAAIALGLLLCLTACEKELPPPTASVPAATPSLTPTPSPTSSPAPVPVRSQEGFQTSGDGNWGVRTFSAEYEDEYGPYFSIDVTLPWTTAEGEGFAVIDQRFQELMEEYKPEVWEAYSSEERPPGNPSLLLCLDPVRREPMETGRLVTFRFLRNIYTGGVHGSCSCWAETYDTATGKRLGFADFFSDPEEAAARIQREMQRQIEENPEGFEHIISREGGMPLSTVEGAFDPTQVYPVEGGFEAFFQWYALTAHNMDAPTFFISQDILADVTALPEEGPPTPEPWGQRKVEYNYYRNGKLMLEYSAAQPVARSQGAGYEAINSHYSSLDDLLAEAEEYSHLTDEIPLDFGGLPFCVHYGLSFSFEGGGVVQMAGGSYYYLGGAHPGHARYSDCFDLVTGKPLELEDLFTDWTATKNRIWEIIGPQVLTSFPEDRVEWSVERAKEGLEEEPEFFLGEDGLTIHYNEYAIASYVEGAFDFLIPPEALNGLLRYPLWG